MIGRVLVRGACRYCSMLCLLTFLWILMPSQKAYGQGLELSGGWAHMTSNNGTDGYQVGAAWWFNRRTTLAANYDSAWDTSSLTNFALASGGLVTTRSHISNLLFGPRIFFSNKWSDKHKLHPFGEAQFGVSWLDQAITANVLGISNASSSSNQFSWMLGGGAEYLLSPHVSGRMNLDYLRTHFAAQGQGSIRLVVGVTYTLGNRGPSR